MIAVRKPFTAPASTYDASKHRKTKKAIILDRESQSPDFGISRRPKSAAAVPMTGIHETPLSVKRQTRRIAMQKFANVQVKAGIATTQTSIQRKVSISVGRTTEGFYDTASHRSQQASQHQSVYQKETTLPKRRCPRCGQPKHTIEVNSMANQMTLQRRSRGLA